MRIVLLDGNTINPGDLSWKQLEDLCEDFTVYPRTPAELVAERMADCEILMTSKCRITRELMESCPKLKYIGVTATGYDNIDVAAAADLGIAVTNIPAYSTEAVAQHAIALLLELTNMTGMHSESVRKGDWFTSPDFCYWKKPLYLLWGKSIGIIGYGSIGKRVAEIARALGMTVNIYSRDREAAVTSDVVSLHCPLTEENRKMINQEFIESMKPGAFLINTARGGLVDEEALAEALRSGKLAGAGVDVLSAEPAKADNPLIGLDNCVVTPHIAWTPGDTRQKIIDILEANVLAWQEGKLLNRVEL